MASAQQVYETSLASFIDCCFVVELVSFQQPYWIMILLCSDCSHQWCSSSFYDKMLSLIREIACSMAI